MKSKKIPVVYAGLDPFMNNNVLNREFMSKFPGGESLTIFAQGIIDAGFEFMTIDLYKKSIPKKPAFLISDMALGVDESTGLIPAFCMSLESPIVANRYYHQLNKKTRQFYKVWDWSGVSTRIFNSKNRFLQNAWPTNSKINEFSAMQWHKRRYITIVCTNKQAFEWHWKKFSLSKPQFILRSFVSNVITSYIKNVDPWMNSNLYLERLKAISYFSQYDDFDLYGKGWDKLSKNTERQIGNQINKVWKESSLISKEQILSNYRFYLCYENTEFPGYLTEKIFDCFFSGVIPVYLGDPEIKMRIPKETFIDVRDFSSFQELDNYLRSMTTSVANDYLEAAREFINSDKFFAFTADNLKKTIVSTINEIYLQYN
jgi:hypothetical protein